MWCRPAFHDGQLLGYACLRAHWPDVGSATPGSYGAVTEIFGEGPAHPAAAARSAAGCSMSTSKSSFWRTFARRTSAKVISAPSLRQRCAQPNASKALAQRYGSETLIGYMAEVMDYSERLMRASLMDLPDGEGVFEDFCDGDGIADDAVRHGCAVSASVLSVEKDETGLIVDFAGTDPQVKGR